MSGRTISVDCCANCLFLRQDGWAIPDYFCDHPGSPFEYELWDPPPYIVPTECPLRTGPTVVELAEEKP